MFYIGDIGHDCFSECADGLFGKDCNLVCNCKWETEVCDKITGICHKTGCKTGFSEESGCQGKYQPYKYLYILGFMNDLGFVYMNDNGVNRVNLV